MQSPTLLQGSSDGRIEIEPELAFLLDYELSQAIGGRQIDKLENVAIMLNGVNRIYEQTNDVLEIRCQLIRVISVKVSSHDHFHFI